MIMSIEFKKFSNLSENDKLLFIDGYISGKRQMNMTKDELRLMLSWLYNKYNVVRVYEDDGK